MILATRGKGDPWDGKRTQTMCARCGTLCYLGADAGLDQLCADCALALATFFAGMWPDFVPGEPRECAECRSWTPWVEVVGEPWRARDSYVPYLNWLADTIHPAGSACCWRHRAVRREGWDGATSAPEGS